MMNQPKWFHTRSFQKLKNLIFAVLFRMGLFDLVRAVSIKFRRVGVILCYHRVIDGDPDLYSIPGTQVDIARFREQLRGLSRKYRIIPFSLFIEQFSKGNIDGRELMLSFDDGFKDNFTIVYPVLREYRAPATFFISPNMLGSPSLIWNNRAWFLLNRTSVNSSLRWQDQELPLGSELEKLKARDLINQTLAPMKEEERATAIEEIAHALHTSSRVSEKTEIMLSRDDISDMLARGLAEFGSHSLTHPLLPLSNDRQRIREVEESKKKLEEVLDRPVVYFAYPGGAYDEKSLQSVRNAGYVAAVATREGLVGTGDDLFSLNRVNVVRDDTLCSLMIRKLVPLYLKNLASTLKKRTYGHT